MQTVRFDENSLKLTGNKIELKSRPVENYSSASSRCTLLGRSYSRPVSAVPLLNLNYNEFEVHPKIRRPLSADFPVGRFKNSLRERRYVSHYVDGETSLESSEETEGGLPSSQLLHNLLNEPLCSWRNGIRSKPCGKSKLPKNATLKFRSDNSDSNETPSAGSDTSSSAESVGVKERSLKELEKSKNAIINQSIPNTNLVDDHQHPTKTIQPDDNQIVSPKEVNFSELEIQYQEESMASERSALIPPKPDEACKNNSPSNTMPLLPGLKTKPPLPKKPDLNCSNSAKSSQKASPHDDINDNPKSNFEHIMENGHLMIPTTVWNKEELDNRQPDIHSQTSSSTLESDTIDVKFQAWVHEEEKASNEIMESEWHTDISLHKLKLQNQDNKHDEKLENEGNKEISNSKPKQSTSPKVVNFQRFDVEELKRDYEKRRKNLPVKNFIKQNIKLSTNQTRKKPTSSIAAPTKNFSAVPIRSYSEYKETNVSPDIDSWMSTNSRELSPKLSRHNEKIKEDLCTKPTSYLDFLHDIEEFEESCKSDDTPERDKEDTTTDDNDGNTYDDIVSILQVLEEQDKISHMKMESIKEIVNNELSPRKEEKRSKSRLEGFIDSVNQIEDIDFDYRHIGNKIAADNYCDDCTKSRDQDQPSRTSLNSSTSLNDIFSYLDEVDKNCQKSLACAKENILITTQMMENNIKLDTIPKLEELSLYKNIELCHVIIDLSLRLKEKSSSISLLQKELSTFRNQVAKMTKETNEVVKERLKTQKNDYENVVKRHQKFIDQLIADKKTLNKQSEGLINEMKVLEDRYNSNLKAAEHKHKVELQKVKEMQVAGEKMRRERWIDTKTQKIKELTVKGLEPELDKMAARHQQELTDLRSLHKREIEDLELRAARKMQQQCEALREQLTAEREKALVHEREVLRQRYEQLVESEERNYQDQRRRLLAEHANRISECEERENSAVVDRDRAIKQAQNEFEDKLQAVVRRHTTELNLLKETTQMEMEAFRNNYKKQAAVQLSEKESQIREKYRKERDKEIEAVIERLEMESNDTKAQIEQSTDNRVRRLREKYETEIKDLEHSEKEASSKYSETKSKLLEADDLVLNLKASIKQLETQLHENKEISDKLSKEREKIKEIVKDEMKQEIQNLEKELLELRNGKDKELQQVYSRVKVAVARKDETISELTRDHTALQEKCVYLENMLEQQRKEYLIK